MAAETETEPRLGDAVVRRSGNSDYDNHTFNMRTEDCGRIVRIGFFRNGPLTGMFNLVVTDLGMVLVRSKLGGRNEAVGLSRWKLKGEREPRGFYQHERDKFTFQSGPVEAMYNVAYGFGPVVEVSETIEGCTITMR